MGDGGRTLVGPVSLARLLDGGSPPAGWLEASLGRLAEVEGRIEAFLPEEERGSRLRSELASAPDDGRLRGVLVGVKDIFRIDGLPLRAGSRLPEAAFDGPEAALVTRLRQEGAVVFGRTRTTEFAMMDPGPTANPHDPAHTPGGSSSGSAAAVAAGIVPLAIGSQTSGSVIRPAAYCGVVGYKPSFGRLPTDGMLPCSPSVDCPGLFTADVASLARACSALVPRWDSEAAQPAKPPRLLVPEGDLLAHAEEGRHAFEGALEELASKGVAVERRAFFQEFGALNKRHADLVAREFGEQHAALYAAYGELYRSCAAGLVAHGQSVDDQRLARCRASRGELRASLEAVLQAEAPALWVSPSAPGPAPRGLDTTGSPAMNGVWTHAGVPVLSLPAGTVDGLPVGLQLAGAAGRDEELLGFALALEGLLAN